MTRPPSHIRRLCPVQRSHHLHRPHPGRIGPKEVTGRAYAVSAASSTRVQATVALPGVIGPKAVSAPALAGSRLANTRETITIKIGGITI